MAEQSSQKKVIKVKGCDGEVFDVEMDVARVSVTWRKMLEDCADGDEDLRPIEVPNIDAATLVKVLEWCKQHAGDSNLDKIIDLDEGQDYDFSEWDKEWVENLDDKMLCAVNLAADYLDIKMLVELGAIRTADIVKSLSLDEIRKRYNLAKDMTPQQESDSAEKDSDSEEQD